MSKKAVKLVYRMLASPYSLICAVSIHFQKSVPGGFCSWSEYISIYLPRVAKS